MMDKRVYVVGDRFVIIDRDLGHYKVVAMYPNDTISKIFVDHGCRHSSLNDATSSLRRFFKVNPVRIYPPRK